MFSCKEARKFVKENISGKRGTIIGYAILYYIVKGLISGVLNDLDGVLGYLLPVLISAVLTPVHVGLFRIITNVLNGKKASFSMLFEDYKHFVNLFIIGLVFNFIIQVGYKVYIVGFIFQCIYIGVLYFFVYNSELSLGEFFNKVFEKIKEYFFEAILLELSYIWPFILLAFVYGIAAIIIIIAVLSLNIDRVTNFTSIEDVLPILSSAIPLVIITIIFVILAITLIIIIIPKLLLAEAKFYSVFETNNDKKSESKFCPNCKTEVKGKFCTNCGTKIKE